MKKHLFHTSNYFDVGLFRPATALAEEAEVAVWLERDKSKIQDYVKEHEKTTAGMATAVFDKDGFYLSKLWL